DRARGDGARLLRRPQRVLGAPPCVPAQGGRRRHAGEAPLPDRARLTLSTSRWPVPVGCRPPVSFPPPVQDPPAPPPRRGGGGPVRATADRRFSAASERIWA